MADELFEAVGAAAEAVGTAAELLGDVVSAAFDLASALLPGRREPEDPRQDGDATHRREDAAPPQEHRPSGTDAHDAGCPPDGTTQPERA